MPVREQNVTDRDELVGRLADIEAHVELRQRHDRLLARDGVPENIEIVDLNMG